MSWTPSLLGEKKGKVTPGPERDGGAANAALVPSASEIRRARGKRMRDKGRDDTERIFSQSRARLTGNSPRPSAARRYARGMTNPLRARALMVVLALSLAGMARADSADPEGSDVLGKRLPDWGDLRFVDAPVHRKLADLKGKVLVIRFWTDQCPFCRASAPVLTGWGDKYRDKGLVVIDIYHPKPPHAVTDDEVRAYAKRIRLRGLLAVDERWSALE